MKYIHAFFALIIVFLQYEESNAYCVACSTDPQIREFVVTVQISEYLTGTSLNQLFIASEQGAAILLGSISFIQNVKNTLGNSNVFQINLETTDVLTINGNSTTYTAPYTIQPSGPIMSAFRQRTSVYTLYILVSECGSYNVASLLESIGTTTNTNTVITGSEAIQNTLNCENSAINLTCPVDTFIYVTSAFYGRQDPTTCSDICLGNPSICNNTVCAAANSLAVVQSTCNYKNTCVFNGGNNLFGDPCPGTYKYLNVDYQCLPTSLLPTTTTPYTAIITDNYATVCEGYSISLSCPMYEYIVITNATYGRQDTTTCTGACNQLYGSASCTNFVAYTSCSLNVTSKLNDTCTFQQTCLLTSINTLFTDPCVGTYKYLDVYYQCV